MPKTNSQKFSAVQIEPSLDKYDNVVLFPDKLSKANEQVKKSGFPRVSEKKYM
jgi:hypothetical protein